MNANARVFFLVLVAWLVGARAMAHDFVSNGIYYKIVSSTKKTCKVVNKSDVYNTYSGNIVIPETASGYTVVAIGTNAFRNCHDLISVSLPASIEYLEQQFEALSRTSYDTFYSCSMLQSINVEKSNPYFSSQDGVLYNKEKTTIVRYPRNKSGNVVLPETVNKIGSSSFVGCTFSSFSVPTAVTHICDSAFWMCRNLEVVNFPSRLEYIGACAFRGCENISDIQFPTTLKTVGAHAFEGCEALSSVALPEKLENIEESTFSACIRLKEIKIPNSVKAIGPYAFAQTAFKNITLPASLTNLDEKAFDQCANIKAAIILSPEVFLLTAFPTDATLYVYDTSQYYAQQRSQLKAFCSITNHSFEYSGKVPILQVQNNMTNDYPGLYASSEVESLQKDAGTYSTNVTINFTGTETFTTNVAYTYTITKAPLTFTLSDAYREYGDGNPTFTYNVSGFKNGEDESVLTNMSLGTDATMSSDAGTYNITLMATARNYDITCRPGHLIINKAPLCVGVNDCQRTYGDANPAFTYYYEGLKLGEATPTMTQPFSTQTSATKTSGVGKYSVTPTGGVAKNYYIAQYNKGYLSINKADLKAKATDVSRLYYEQNPALPLTYTGFRNNDNENNLTVVPTATTKATKTSNAGTYAINVSGGQSNNYNISYEQGTLTIKKRTLAAKARSYTRKFNEANPVFDIDFSGFVAGEDESVILVPLTISCEATRKADVGTYGIYLSGGEADNYTFNYTPGTLTIQKAEQTLVWEEEFEEAEIGDQIALTAEVNSGEDITYTCDDENIATIYQVGTAYFLDCRKAGVVYIRAQQEGTKNYLPSNRIAKKLVICDSTMGIRENAADNTTSLQYYDLSGRKQNAAGKGFCIIRTEDGKTVKVLKK